MAYVVLCCLLSSYKWVVLSPKIIQITNPQPVNISHGLLGVSPKNGENHQVQDTFGHYRGCAPSGWGA